jgi:hypothetical protein
MLSLGTACPVELDALRGPQKEQDATAMDIRSPDLGQDRGRGPVRRLLRLGTETALPASSPSPLQRGLGILSVNQWM